MKEYLLRQIRSTLQALGIHAAEPLLVERPRQPGHGDLTTNVALVLAKTLQRNPRQLAGQIMERMEIDPALISSAEIAGPGFLYFRFTSRFFLRELKELLSAGERYGRAACA